MFPALPDSCALVCSKRHAISSGRAFCLTELSNLIIVAHRPVYTECGRKFVVHCHVESIHRICDKMDPQRTVKSFYLLKSTDRKPHHGFETIL